MASILDKFGIKEVGDVTFYALGSDGRPTYPVLYLDTCTVTTLEQTADEVEAKGGKGNVSLMVWDTSKELNVTLSDALFSAKSMAIMFGNGTVRKYNTSTADGKSLIMKTEQFAATALEADTLPGEATAAASAANIGGWNQGFTAPDGKIYVKKNPKFFDEDGNSISEKSKWVAGSVLFCSYDLEVDGAVIEINSDTFPGSYYVTIDTYARMQGSGEDDFFQLILPNCKVLSENSIEMSSDGDPSVLNMNLRVLKPANGGAMVYMVKYGLTGTAADAAAASGFSFYHNHVLNPETT